MITYYNEYAGDVDTWADISADAGRCRQTSAKVYNEYAADVDVGVFIIRRPMIRGALADGWWKRPMSADHHADCNQTVGRHHQTVARLHNFFCRPTTMQMSRNVSAVLIVQYLHKHFADVGHIFIGRRQPKCDLSISALNICSIVVN